MIIVRQLFLWGFLVCYSNGVTAIVNVDNLHFQGKKKPVSGSVSLAGASFSGNSEKSNIDFNGQVQWNRENYISLLVLGYEYGKSNGKRNENKTYMHLRHVRHHSESFDYEIYTQVEENEFTRLTYRGLLGGGLRFLLTNSQRHVTFFGAGGFREVERIANHIGYSDEQIQQTGRWNFYLMSRFKNENLRFTNTLYWQPRMAHFPDRRALFVSILRIKATDSISMRLSIEASHDSLPPPGVEQTDRRIRTGLEYEF